MGPCMSQSKENKQRINNIKSLPLDEKAILDCKNIRDNIKKELKVMDQKKSTFREKAKLELKANNKSKAKLYLNRSKLLEKRYEVYTGQLTMIEDQITNIQSMKMQKDAINVLKQGNEVMKELNKEVNIQKWEDLRDDMNSLKQEQDEISSMLKNYGIDEVKYNEELDKDLEKLIEAENPKLKLPDVPKEKAKIQNTAVEVDEEDEQDHKHIEILDAA